MERVKQSKQTVDKLRQFLNLARRCGAAMTRGHDAAEKNLRKYWTR
jgi:hypothetical protein